MYRAGMMKAMKTSGEVDSFALFVASDGMWASSNAKKMMKEPKFKIAARNHLGLKADGRALNPGEL
jgi:hypothetical protein